MKCIVVKQILKHDYSMIQNVRGVNIEVFSWLIELKKNDKQFFEGWHIPC